MVAFGFLLLFAALLANLWLLQKNHLKIESGWQGSHS